MLNPNSILMKIKELSRGNGGENPKGISAQTNSRIIRQCTHRETETQQITMKSWFNMLDDLSKYTDISRKHSNAVIMENLK